MFAKSPGSGLKREVELGSQSSVQVSSVQDGIYALGKTHIRSTPSLRSFPNVALVVNWKIVCFRFQQLVLWACTVLVTLFPTTVERASCQIHKLLCTYHLNIGTSYSYIFTPPPLPRP